MTPTTLQPVQHPTSPAFQPPFNPATLDLTGRGREGTEVVTSLDSEKMNKLRSDLATVQQNCKVFGDLLTEVSRGGGSGSTSDLELLEVGRRRFRFLCCLLLLLHSNYFYK